MLFSGFKPDLANLLCDCWLWRAGNWNPQGPSHNLTRRFPGSVQMNFSWYGTAVVWCSIGGACGLKKSSHRGSLINEVSSCYYKTSRPVQWDFVIAFDQSSKVKSTKAQRASTSEGERSQGWPKKLFFTRLKSDIEGEEHDAEWECLDSRLG